MGKITIQANKFGLNILGLRNHPGGFQFTFHEALSLFLEIDRYIANYEYARQTTPEGRYEIRTHTGTMSIVIREEEDGIVTENEGERFFLAFNHIMRRFYKENKNWLVKMMESSADRIRQTTF